VFPAIITTPERAVRVELHGSEPLGAAFLLYFHEGIVVYAMEPGMALARTNAIEIGDMIVSANNVSLGVGTMDEALAIVRDELPEVEFGIRGWSYHDPGCLHLHLPVLHPDGSFFASVCTQCYSCCAPPLHRYRT
jgi:hypothetical protein